MAMRPKSKVQIYGAQAKKTILVENNATEGAQIGTDLRLPDGTVPTLAELAIALGVGTEEPFDPLGGLSVTIWRLIREVPIYTESPISPTWEYTLDGVAIGNVGFAAINNGIASGSLAGDLVLAPVLGRIYIPQVAALDGVVIDADGTNSPTIALELAASGVVGRIGVAGAADGVATGSSAGDLVLAPTAGSVYIPQVSSTPAISIDADGTNSPVIDFERGGTDVAAIGVAGAANGIATGSAAGDIVLSAVAGGVFIPVRTGRSALLLEGDVGSSTVPMMFWDNTGSAADRRLWRIRETDTLDRGFNFDGILSGDNADNALSWGSDFTGSIARAFKFWADGRVSFANELMMFTPTGTATTAMTLSSLGDVVLTLAADTDNVTEDDNPTLLFSQDGAGVLARVGLNGQAGVDSQNATFTNALANALCFHHPEPAGSLAFGTETVAAYIINTTNENVWFTVGRFTAAAIAVELEAAAPFFLVDETDAAANERQWVTRSVAGVWRLDTYSDASVLGNNAIAIDRTGTTVSEIELNATTFDLNGNLDLSGTALIAGLLTLTAAALALEIESASPMVLMDETDAAANERQWRISTAAGLWRLDTYSDAGAVGTGAIIIDRTGTTVSEIELNATLIDINANVDISGTAIIGGLLTLKSLRIEDAGATDFVLMSHDGTDFTMAFTNTTAMNVDGLIGVDFNGRTSGSGIFVGALGNVANTAGTAEVYATHADGSRYISIGSDAATLSPTFGHFLYFASLVSGMVLAGDSGDYMRFSKTVTAADRLVVVFTPLEIESTAPDFLFDETDAAANERQWRQRAVAGVWSLDTYSDAGALGTSALSIDRSGTTVTEIELNATTIDINATNILGGLLTVPLTVAGVSPVFQIGSTGNAGARGIFLRANTGNEGGAVQVLRIPANDLTSVAAVVANDQLGTMSFGASDATSIELGIKLLGLASETWSSTAHGSRFEIQTVTPASTTFVTRAQFSDVEVQLDATTFDFNGTLDIDGGNHDISTTGTLTLSGTGETLATFVDDGAVTLYHNNVSRIATSATGVDMVAGLLLTVLSATGGAGFRLPHGAAPSAPVDGDLWTTTTGLFVRINGATVGPLT